jgi:hypothetical protein
MQELKYYNIPLKRRLILSFLLIRGLKIIRKGRL